jgi:hypothetical protein
MITSCKLCIFAKYDGITQTDCSLDKIEDAKVGGHTVLGAYDEDKEFFIIPNYICMGYRTEEWREKHKSANLAELVKEESTLKYHAIIFLKHQTDLAKQRIEELQAEAIPPEAITIVRPLDSLSDTREILSILQATKVKKYNVRSLLEELSDDAVIDLICNSKFYPYFLMMI